MRSSQTKTSIFCCQVRQKTLNFLATTVTCPLQWKSEAKWEQLAHHWKITKERNLFPYGLLKSIFNDNTQDTRRVSTWSDFSEFFNTIKNVVGTQVQRLFSNKYKRRTSTYKKCSLSLRKATETHPKLPVHYSFFPSQRNNRLCHLLTDSIFIEKKKAPFHRGSRFQKEQLRKLKWASKSVPPYGTRHERQRSTRTLVLLNYQEGQRSYSQNLPYNTLQGDNVLKWRILFYTVLTLFFTFRWQGQKAVPDTTWRGRAELLCLLLHLGVSEWVPHTIIPAPKYQEPPASQGMRAHLSFCTQSTQRWWPPSHSTDKVASSNASNLFVAFQVPRYVVATATGMPSDVTTLIFYFQTCLVVS